MCATVPKTIKDGGVPATLSRRWLRERPGLFHASKPSFTNAEVVAALGFLQVALMDPAVTILPR